MALSKPNLGIQSPIQCQLCERDPKISWKCLECDLLMCSACNNNIHPKIKTAGEHKIIPIKDIASSPSYVPSKINMTLVETYETKLGRVNKLAISLDGSLWISDKHYKKRIRLFTTHTGLQKVKWEENKLKVISSFNIVICDIAVTPGNNLLIVTEGSKLKQIKSGTTKIVDTVYDLEPATPVCIHVTRKNKIIVGTYEGTVVVMDHDGNREKVYDKYGTKDSRGYPGYPEIITATSNDNIFVVANWKVVVLGHEDIVNTYSGHSVINTKESPFRPNDLTTTPSDNVIVVDTNKTLHILNSSGYLVTHINTEGITYFLSIGLAMEEQSCMLYSGSYSKICKLNLIGY